MKKIKLPSRLKIGGHTYKVIFPYEWEEREDIHAQHEPNFHELRIGNRGDEGSAWAALFHEMLHAIDRISGHDRLQKIEEDEASASYVDALAEGLYQVLNDNRLLRKP